MAEFTLLVNRKSHTVEAPPEMPLLWVIRDLIGLTGTKFGCGIGSCSACTVHIAGEPRQSCQVTLEEAAGREVTTIEGLSEAGDHPVQSAWIAEEVPQCGYCQPGMIMRAAALVEAGGGSTPAEIDRGMREHICRCGTYDRIRTAIARAAREG